MMDDSLPACGAPSLAERTSAPWDVPDSWPLLGREADLAYLAATIASESFTGVVLVGDAGVGKTRLTVEALRETAARGYATEWVVATRATASIPFGPFAPLLPETPGPMTSRLELLCRLADAITAGARGRRLVVGIDDAHLLDDASAALVHQLAVRRDVFVLVTVRTGERTPDPIVALWKEGLAVRLELQVLSEEQVGDLVRSVLGGQVDGPTAARLWEATQGNLLFLREVLLAGLERRALTKAGGVWSWQGPMAVSLRLQEAVAARLGTLDPDQAALMEVLAFSEPAPASFLERRFSPGTLEGSERSGMTVVEKAGRRVLVRLAHPLYGEVARARCPVLRARSIHRELAAGLEASGARRREDLLRLATARLEIGESVAPELLVAGARQALRAFDLELAERLARAAAEAGAGIPAQYILMVLLVGQGRFPEETGLGNGERGVATNDSERALSALRRALVLQKSADRADDAEEILLRAERDIEDADLRDLLAWLRGGILLLSGRPAEAATVLSDVLERPGASESVCLFAAITAVAALAIVGRAEKAVALAEGWIGAADRRAEELPLVAGELLAAESYALCLAGRLDEAQALAAKEYRTALSHRAHETTAMSALLLGRTALARGQVKTATRWLREAAGLSRSRSQGAGLDLLPMCLADLACAAALGGDLTTVAAVLVEAEAALTPARAFMKPEVALARAWVAAARGEVSNARVIALQAADRAEESGAYGYALLALHDVARLGDPRRVAVRLRCLASRVEGPFAPAFAAHAEALVARDGHGLDLAAESFEAMGAQLLAAEAAAEATAAHRNEGEKSSMFASSARARRLLEACEGAQTPALSGLVPELLTPREREVAVLAAQGLTSPEIAQRLVLSIRTVQNHLQRGYAKLGVANRAELRLVLPE